MIFYIYNICILLNYFRDFLDNHIILEKGFCNLTLRIENIVASHTRRRRI